MTGRVIRAEWQKLWVGRTWWVLGGVAVLWCAYIAYSFGLLEVSPPDGAAQTTAPSDPASLTALVARQWFQMHLVTSLLGALAVTREHSAHTLRRSVLLAGDRGRLFRAKIVVAAGLGVVYGLVAVAGAAASAWISLAVLDVPPTTSRELTLTLIGVFAVSILGALWGCLLGWALRHPVVTIVVLLVSTLMVEPLLHTLSPDAFSWTFSIALGAIYLDGKEGMLDLPWAYAVALAWITGAAALAATLVRRRDVE
nr:ABC transporter permease [uncultured Actinotalea sp.]